MKRFAVATLVLGIATRSVVRKMHKDTHSVPCNVLSLAVRIRSATLASMGSSDWTAPR
jgi:hypothetical protein